ncbi:unnamed protein product [Ambrosiozyma monospora]|uniref:Unnamed protein product n=1 Tax=Ambrosiozyma monospora TaxID=43982 RepID=A0A9W7DEJ6_AMBMO|nr:unnamed protein product [Ambrosiozyma monospora]
MSTLAPLIKKLTNGAADGTGIVKLVGLTQNMLKLKDPHDIPSVLIKMVEGEQQAQFGSYPDHKDIAPSAVFLAIFAVLFLAHTTVFAINYRRGHKFFLSLGFAFYCTLRWLGFALRLTWAKDLLKLHIGITGTVLTILATVFIASFNLVLAQRIFTWRHPVFGNSKLFWTLMYTLYSIVVAVVAMTIVAGTVPYLYFLSRSHYDMCRNVVKVTSILITLYSLLAIILVVAAYAIPAHQKDKDALVFQPFWIKSFKPTYFVQKGADKECEDQFAAKFANDPREPKRTMLGGSLGKSAELEEFLGSGDAKFSANHNVSILIIATTTILVFVGALMRCIAMFEDKTYATQNNIHKPVVMYVVWGAFETIANILYLVGRVDLRFYRPDSFKRGAIAPVDTVSNEVVEDKDEKSRSMNSSEDV